MLIKNLFKTAAQSNFVLAPTTVSIWQVSTVVMQAYLAQLTTILTETERQKANNFVFEKDKNRFIIARAVLRLLLGHYLKVNPAEIVFSQAEHGKPFVSNYPTLPIEFNISHSHEMILYSFARDIALGIDVEFMRTELDVSGIAKRFFAAAEYQYLSPLPVAEKIAAFYAIWTKKEAVTKMLGTGLYHSLSSINVLDHCQEYFLTDIIVPKGYTGALACTNKPKDIIKNQL